VISLNEQQEYEQDLHSFLPFFPNFPEVTAALLPLDVTVIRQIMTEELLVFMSCLDARPL
jgi:hypothetical protein